MTGPIKTIFAISAAALMLAGCSGPKTSGGGGGNTGGGVEAPKKKPKEKGQDQKILLHWKQNKWWVQLNGGNDENPSQATIKLDKDTGPTMFEVTIAGKSTTFASSGALQVWEDSKTSNPAGSTQILGPLVSQDGKKLTFFDLNQGPEMKIYYAITLANGDKIDPIVDNGGGGNMD